MNKEELEKIIFGKSSQLDIANRLCFLTEKQRRALATHVVSLRQQIVNEKAKKNASILVINTIKSIKKNGFCSNDSIQKIQLAIHALCSYSVVKSKGQGYLSYHQNELAKIYSDRKPEWLNDWLEHEFSLDLPRISIPIIFEWVKIGLCKKPSTAGYIKEFVKYFAEENRKSNQDQYLTLSQRLKQNIEHINDVWEMFKVEHDGFNANYFLTHRHDYDTPDVIENWPDVIIKFSHEEILDRQKLLNTILDGLHYDIKQNQLSGMHKLFEQLQPSLDELSQTQDKLTSLLPHKVGHVVNFSLKNLAKLEIGNKLDLTPLLSNVSAVFSKVAKGNSIKALKLLAQLIKKDQQHNNKNQFIEVIIHALQHPNVDVQSLAITLLNKLKHAFNEENKQSLALIAEYVNLSVRPDFFKLIEKENQQVNQTSHQIDLQELAKTYVNTPEQALIDLGLDGIDLSQDDIGNIKPIKTDFLLFSIQNTCKKIEPINDIDALIQSISSSVEGLEDCNEFERILDGLSRLCNQKHHDFDEKVAPLRHRLSKEFDKHESLVSFWSNIREAFKSLLLTWINGSNEPLSKRHYYIEYETLMSRVENIQKRILKKLSYPLLSAPTHENGWIEPTTWVAKIHKFQQSGLELDRHDFCQSLMRLMPVNKRDKNHALTQAKVLTGHLGRIARFMLGASLDISPHDKKDYDLWITAARCLSPDKDWSKEFEIFTLKNDFPGGLKTTQITFSITADDTFNFAHFKQNIKFGHDNKTYNFNDIDFNKLQILQHFKHSLSWNQLPTITIHRHDAYASSWSYHVYNTWLSQWMYSLWPSHLDPITAIAIKRVSGNLDTNSTNLTPTYGCFQGLFQTPYPLSQLSHVLLFMGLNAIDQDAKFASIDAFIEAVELSKLNESYAANALIQLINGKDTKLKRIADVFKQITPVSTLHAYSICQIIQQVLCAIDLKQRNLFHLTEILLETLIELQIPLSQSCHSELTQIKGNSKIAKVTKRLISLNFNNTENINNLKLKKIQSRLSLLESQDMNLL